MKKALIIGGAGFVGPYLAEHLADDCRMEVYATKRPHSQKVNVKAEMHDLDILDRENIVRLLYKVRPDYIFHLAAQSSAAAAWEDPALTIDVNVKGSVNVLEAVRCLPYKPRVLVVGSGEEYGHTAPGETPIAEDTRLRPGNLYAATKACQNMIAKIYADAYRMEIVMARAFNHIGPGQAPIYVISDFCRQVAEIEKGLRESIVSVGNIDSMRDFTDVRDVVRAYALLIQRGAAGETYNVGSGHAVAIREVLEMILTQTNTDIKLYTEPGRIRPADVAIIEADTGKLFKTVGWEKRIPLEQSIRETLEYWRAAI